MPEIINEPPGTGGSQSVRNPKPVFYFSENNGKYQRAGEAGTKRFRSASSAAGVTGFKITP